MRRWLAALWLCSVACSAGGTMPGTGTATPSPSFEATPTPSPREEAPAWPGYNAPLPRDPEKLAGLLVRIYRQLPHEIETWINNGGRLSSPRADRIHRGALAQQRSFRLLVRRPPLYNRVDRRLPRRVGRIVGRHIDAQTKLSALATPVEPPVRWKTYRPKSPHALHRYYKAGQRRFDVPWQVLASVNAIESRFGRILGPSSAGALGPMQFMPATWDIYGRGDIMDPHDSIIAAARYLAASGAPGDLRAALFAYNRSDAYVDAILTYAREMTRDKRLYYAYYFWEVFVRTTEGDIRLTGPGT